MLFSAWELYRTDNNGDRWRDTQKVSKRKAVKEEVEMKHKVTIGIPAYKAQAKAMGGYLYTLEVRAQIEKIELDCKGL